MGNKIEQNKLIEILQQRFIITGRKDQVISVRQRYSMDSMTIVVYQLFSSQQAVLLMNYIADFKKLNSRYLSKPIETYDCQSSTGFFEKSLKKYVLFDLPAFTLDQEISVRKSTARYFKDFQLWSILVSAISAMGSLQRGNIRHQQISLDSIYLTSKGQVKIMNPWFTRKIDKKEQAGCLDQINTQTICSTKSNCNFQSSVKNDVKQFAGCIIDAGCLYNSSNELKSYNTAIFKERYKMKQLLQLLDLMQSDEMKRPDWISLQDMIVYQPYTQSQSRRSVSQTNQEPNDPILIRNNSLKDSIKSISDLRASIPIKFKSMNSQSKPIKTYQKQSPNSLINQTLLFQPPQFKFHLKGDASAPSYQADPALIASKSKSKSLINPSYLSQSAKAPIYLEHKAEPQKTAPKFKYPKYTFQQDKEKNAPKFQPVNPNQVNSRVAEKCRAIKVTQSFSASKITPLNIRFFRPDSQTQRCFQQIEYLSCKGLQQPSYKHKNQQSIKRQEGRQKREYQPSEVTLFNRKSGTRPSQFTNQEQRQIPTLSRSNSLPINFKSPTNDHVLRTSKCTVDPFVSDVKKMISSRLNQLTNFKQSSLLTPFKRQGQDLKFYKPGPLASSNTKGISIRPISLSKEKIIVRSPLRISYK